MTSTDRGTAGNSFFRHDRVKPNRDFDATKDRTIAVVLKDKGPLAAALLAYYEQVRYDGLPGGATANPLVALGRPTERRFSVHCLFNF